MSISQQLVRKLLKAHTSSSRDEDSDPAKRLPVALNQRKRKKDHHDAGVATVDDIVKYQRNIVRMTQREMVISKDVSKKSNGAAFHRLLQQRDQQTMRRDHTRRRPSPQRTIPTAGAARSSTSVLAQPSLVKIPTFQQERYDNERNEKKRMKLAQALEHWKNTHPAKKRRQKTIFG